MVSSLTSAAALTILLSSFLPSTASATPSFYSHSIFTTTPSSSSAQASMLSPDVFRPQAINALSAATDLPKGTDMRTVKFEGCGEGSNLEGSVKSVRVGPCVAGEGEACEVMVGKDYTVEITYETSSSFVPAVDDFPRSNVLASYTSPGREPGPYPGQSFSACSYTTCPLLPSTQSLVPLQTYTFPLHGFPQPLDALTFNITSSLDGPSVFCARVPVKWAAALDGDDKTGGFWNGGGGSAKMRKEMLSKRGEKKEPGEGESGKYSKVEEDEDTWHQDREQKKKMANERRRGGGGAKSRLLAGMPPRW